MGIRVLRVTEEALTALGFLADGYHAYTVEKGTGVPRDAKVVRVGYDPAGWLNIFIQSDAWPEVKDGAELRPENYIHVKIYNHLIDVNQG